MTRQDFIQRASDRFAGELLTDRIIPDAESFSTRLAKEQWPEISRVTVEIVENRMEFNLEFNNEQDYMWWKLKYE